MSQDVTGAIEGWEKAIEEVKLSTDLVRAGIKLFAVASNATSVESWRAVEAARASLRSAVAQEAKRFEVIDRINAQTSIAFDAPEPEKPEAPGLPQEVLSLGAGSGAVVITPENEREFDDVDDLIDDDEDEGADGDPDDDPEDANEELLEDEDEPEDDAEGDPDLEGEAEDLDDDEAAIGEPEEEETPGT